MHMGRALSQGDRAEFGQVQVSRRYPRGCDAPVEAFAKYSDPFPGTSRLAVRERNSTGSWDDKAAKEASPRPLRECHWRAWRRLNRPVLLFAGGHRRAGGTYRLRA